MQRKLPMRIMQISSHPDGRTAAAAECANCMNLSLESGYLRSSLLLVLFLPVLPGDMFFFRGSPFWLGRICFKLLRHELLSQHLY
jgi:hypothetical protein